MKLSEYFQIVHPKYIYLKLTPDTSIRNYNSTNVVKSIHYIQKGISQRIYRKEKRLCFETAVKCTYLIDIYKYKVEFYYIVPQQYVNIAKEKIREIWPNITIDEADGVPGFSQDALKYQLCYRKEDTLSLAVDKKSNEPLNDILNVIDIMQEKDRVSIVYNFMPWDMVSWRTEYAKTIAKLKAKQPIEREKLSGKYLFKFITNALIEVIDGLMEVLGDFLGNKKKENQLNFVELAVATLNLDKNLDSATHKKKDDIILKTQALVISDSTDKFRKRSNALSVCQAYKSIEGDNELVYKPVKKPINIESYSLPAEENKMSINECQNLIQLPGRELLQQFGIIKKVNTLESEVPKELQKGTKLIGINICKGNETKAHLTTDKDYKNLAVAIIAPSRSGKTSFMQNLAVNCVNADECVVMLDYIETCQASKEIESCFKKEQILSIDLSDLHNLPSFSYCEANINCDDPLYVYDNLKRQANLLAYLINSVNVDNKELAPRMDRYLKAAANIVYSVKGCTFDILKVLENYEIREKYIKQVPEKIKEYLSESISYLEDLDEWSKGTKDNPPEKIGTHTSYISGILDRFYVLKGNTAMEIMMSKRPKDNDLNLVEEIEKNQLIVIKMPEAIFPSEQERDIAVTYWITKLYLAGQVRADKIPDKYKRKSVNIFTDEINQLENAERFVGSRLDKTAKFGIKFIISAMYINQLRIRDKLRNANTSYILISGADKVNYTELKEEFQQFGYQLEDLMNLKRYYSLNYIKYEKGYWAGITKLPPPIK